MKPEAGQWWQMKDDAETRCFIVGECRNGNYVIEWKDGEYSEDNMDDWEHIPDCDDFNWKEPETVNDELKEQVAAFIGNYYGDQCDEYEQDCIICSKWKAFRELFELPEPPKPEPQPAEDPDEWVEITNPYHVIRKCDQLSDYGTQWYPPSDFTRAVGKTLAKCGFAKVRCRRRDLPKVEQKTLAELCADKTPTAGVSILGGPHDVCVMPTAEDVQKAQPEPQKTRVRLWARPDGTPYFAPFFASKSDSAILVDSEGFYVEGGQS